VDPIMVRRLCPLHAAQRNLTPLIRRSSGDRPNHVKLCKDSSSFTLWVAVPVLVSEHCSCPSCEKLCLHYWKT
jgi:hypothetical protein